MAYTAPTAAVAGVAYTADDTNKIVDDMVFFYNNRPLANGDSSTAAWTITAGAATWEDDTDAANFYAQVVTPVASTVIVLAIARWSSDTTNDTAVEFRVKCVGAVTGTSYGATGGTQGTSNVDCKEQASIQGYFTALAADTYTFTLQAARNNAGETISISDRQIVAIVIPTGA